MGRKTPGRSEVHNDASQRDAEDNQPQECRGGSPIALERLVVFDRCGPRVPSRDRVLGKLGDKGLNRLFRVEADLRGVRANERATEDTARQA
jgi:hypothetical protein